MTAQETAKQGWSRLKGWRYKGAAAFLFVSGSVLGMGLWRDELHQLWIWFVGVAPGAIGTLMILAENYMKRTDRTVAAKISEATPRMASGIAEKVVDEVRSEVRELTKAMLTMGAAQVTLASAVAETEQTRAKDHAENTDQHRQAEKHIEILAGDVAQLKVGHGQIREAISHLGEAVKSVKPGWEPKQV